MSNGPQIEAGLDVRLTGSALRVRYTEQHIPRADCLPTSGSGDRSASSVAVFLCCGDLHEGFIRIPSQQVKRSNRVSVAQRSTRMGHCRTAIRRGGSMSLVRWYNTNPERLFQ